MSKGECCAFFAGIAAAIHKGVGVICNKTCIPGFRNFKGFLLAFANIRGVEAAHPHGDVVQVSDSDAVGIKAGIGLPLDGYVEVFQGLILHKVKVVNICGVA